MLESERSGAGPPAGEEETTRRRKDPEAWVARSDEAAWPVLATVARFEPEHLGRLGFPGVDGEVSRLLPDVEEERLRCFEDAARSLVDRQAKEPHPKVRRDLEIVARHLRQVVDGRRLEAEWMLPSFHPAELIRRGVGSLLTGPVTAERREAATIRLRRYAGLEGGDPPLTRQAEIAVRSRLHRPRLLGPDPAAAEHDLAATAGILAGLRRLLRQSGVSDHAPAVALLARQLDDYAGFVRRRLLPRSRADFRLPPEVYAGRLRRCGVEAPVDEILGRARMLFAERRYHLGNHSRLADALRRFETGSRNLPEQPSGPPLATAEVPRRCRRHLAELRRILRREKLLTLPRQALRVRLARAGDVFQLPLPHFVYPRLIGDAGGPCEIVIPRQTPEEDGTPGDWRISEGTWCLAVHEGVPGHALQLAVLLDRQVSLARRVFGYNPAATEGWAVYAESLVLPFLPLDVQVFLYRRHLLRAARTLLDLGLHHGLLTAAEAAWTLREQVGISKPMTDRYLYHATRWMPGHAVTYFSGYAALSELRTEVELASGPGFDARSYHDSLLAQGWMPLSLLREQILEDLAADDDGTGR